MDIDLESIGLVSLIFRDSPKDRNLLICVLARSMTPPTRINFDPSSSLPSFYGYSNEKIPFYLMSKKILTNVPRLGYEQKIIPAVNLARAEGIINNAPTWDLAKKLELVSKLLTLKNTTRYHDVQVYVMDRAKAEEYISAFAKDHMDKISDFLGPELMEKIAKIKPTKVHQSGSWPSSASIKGSKFIFDDENWIEFETSKSNRFKVFERLFAEKGGWVRKDELAEIPGIGDLKRTINFVCERVIKQNEHARKITIEKDELEGKSVLRIVFS